MTGVPAELSARAPTLWRNVVHLGAARAAVLGARAGLFFALGLALPPATFGAVAVLFTLGVAANLVLEMGIGLWLTRQGAVAHDETLAGLGGLVVLRLVLVIPVLALYLGGARAMLGPSAPWALVLSVGLFHLLLQVCQTLYAFLRGADSPALEGTTSLLLHAAELAVLTAWFVASSRNPAVLFATLAGLRGAAVLALTTVVAQREGARLDVRAAVRLVRENRAAIGGFALLSVAQFVIAQADTILLGAWASAEETGRYWACYRLLQNLLLPVDLLLLATFPRLANAGSGPRLDAAYRGLHRLGGGWTLCVVALMVVQPRWIVSVLLHDGFQQAAPLLALLAIAVGILALPPYGLGLAMTESPTTMLRAYGTAAGLNLALNLVLVPHHGAWGAAWATLATHLLLKVLFARAFRARGLDPWAAGPLLAAALPLLAWAAMVAAFRPAPALALLLLGVAAGAALAPGLRPLFGRTT